MALLPVNLNLYEKSLNTNEAAMIKAHTKMGVQIVEKNPEFPEEVKLVISQHHEYFTGGGYPNDLHGDSIYYPARVIAIADAFSALTTRHSGRQPFTPRQAIDYMNSEKSKYDPKLFKSFELLWLAGQKKKSA
jgi:HD-GYP domain-containing protein (c-di-GMP phosphodiesterase class II)